VARPALALLAFALAAPPVRGEVLAELEGEQTALFEAVAPGVAVLTAGRVVGAGFAVAPGLLLTAAHVVEGVSGLDVRLRDGRVVRGEVVERAAGGLDVALVRIPVDLPVLPLAPSAGLHPGRVVATVGHPDGNRFTLGTGVVAQEPGEGPDPALVRLQLPLRPGASGGPVVDRAGRVVGVVALGASGTVTFAVRTEAALGALRALATVAVAAPSPASSPAPAVDAVPLAAALPVRVPPAEGVAAAPEAAADGPVALTGPELVTAPPDRPPRRARAAGRAAGPIPRVVAPALVEDPSPDPSPRFAWRGGNGEAPGFAWRGGTDVVPRSAWRGENGASSTLVEDPSPDPSPRSAWRGENGEAPGFAWRGGNGEAPGFAWRGGNGEAPGFAWRGGTDVVPRSAWRGEREVAHGERPLLSLAPAQRGRGVGERGSDRSPIPARSAETWSLLLVGVGLALGAALGVLVIRGIGRRRST
jgi:S1-C subfamily serine protease